MRVLRNIFSQLHEYVLWLLLSTVLWGWIFASFVTDTKAEKKVVIYVDAVQCADTELAAALEEHMPEGLRMIQVHPFSYAMFDTNALLNADLYIVSSSRAAEYLESFAPLAGLPADLGGEYWVHDGVPYGIRLCGAADGRYFTCSNPGEPDEDCYLFFGVNGLHAAALTGAGDDAAIEVCRTLTGLLEGAP